MYLFLTPFSGVRQKVSGQILLAEECLVAAGARHRFGAFVHKPDVGGEPQFSIECPITVWACVRIFTGMVENVGSQLRRLYERFAAELTCVRFFTRMGAHVSV